MAVRECASEFNECLALADYFRLRGIRFSHLAQETPSGSYQYGKWQPNMRQLQKNKAVGVNKGVPDYIAVIERPNPSNIQAKTSKLLFIEMKREKLGKVSVEQAEWINALNKVPGVVAVVCRGFDAAKQVIDALC